jgi:hypothetical protein
MRITNIVFLCGALMVLNSCERGRLKERWVIPNGYVGWLRLDYSIPGRPLLPIEGGRLVARFPANGRLQTQTTNRPRIDDNEYESNQPAGLIRLQHGIGIHVSGYAAQSAFTYAVGKLGGNVPPPQFACVFVGTRADFVENVQDCVSWDADQPQPPLSKHPMKVGGPQW